MIDRLQIENFKSIRSLSLSLQAINVLIGGNGAGKSNFIQFFHLLRVLQQNQLKKHVATGGYADSFLHHGRKRSSHISGSVALGKYNGYRFKLIPTDSDSLIFHSEDAGFRPNTNVPLRWFPHHDIYSHESDVLQNPLKGSRDEYIQSAFRSFRIYHFHDTSRTAPLRTPCRLDQNRTLASDGDNLPAFLYWMQQQHPKSFHLLERTLQSVAPFFGHFALEPDRLSPNFIKLTWQEKGSEQLYTAQHFSDGTLRFIALSALLLQPDPPATIIIDEPELGLHPKAIVKLASMIQRVSNRSQVIISTQSVPLVDCFAPDTIITVDRKEDQSVFERLNEDRLKEWLDDYSLGELWTKHVIKGQP